VNFSLLSAIVSLPPCHELRAFMFATIPRLLTGTAAISSLFFAARDCTTLLLVIWTAAIAVFVDSNPVARFLWIPVSLGLVGVLGSILILAIPADLTLAANVATLVLFVVSFEVLKKRHPKLALNKRRG
jgi:hypothetical protein